MVLSVKKANWLKLKEYNRRSLEKKIGRTLYVNDVEILVSVKKKQNMLLRVSKF